MSLGVTWHPVNPWASKQANIPVPMQVIASGKGECLGSQNISEIFTLLTAITINVDYSSCKKATLNDLIM